MGGCCSCLGGKDKSSGASGSQTEMTSRKTGGSSKSSDIIMSPSLSARSIKLLEGGTKVTGTGLALVNLTLEQDAAYWEWQISEEPGGEKGAGYLKFGLSKPRDRAFYKSLEGKTDPLSPEDEGTELMSEIEVSDGDTVGVAIQQVDLPMIQFLLNGEPLHEVAINRFRGTVYPSVFIPAKEEESSPNIAATLVTDEGSFKEMSPHARFGPLIKSRGLI
mmetsp:Transcript_2905/g.4249  ORF Transcript_2905/g.4249 Transcript_2905/m.4249 type:complete len:219 (-) Transcript_2905:691-1347(-)|eukprot:CAMPEP_0118688372 /NCGR_PEP_ID=MMETSP0800-20121206/8883_1 /TAXON_ID=210618 ORGANISM="Striatella unipunctata, Strain CCMP2910" /NCGR_SAMPLE_ID=MMETSP0800 /ASSEMBLY_ACC=CAM_ASM_000638 /LENGTH=218 /DNA_ID=CAMNT_0006585623 /DNA_START=142 /DNA_END=798 /DNA_ORIENTATION=+